MITCAFSGLWRRAQIVEMRKWLSAQIASRKKQDIPAGIKHLNAELKAMIDAQISDLEQRICRTISSEEISATNAHLLRSIPGIGLVYAAVLTAEMPELGRITAGGQSLEDDGRCDTSSFRQYLALHATTRSLRQWQSARKRAESRTRSSSLPSHEG